jgi:hypothetical protein
MHAATRTTRSVVTAALLALMLIAPATAHAWKPFTHNFTGEQAYADVIDDGQITIANESYSVAPQIVTALESWPAFYNAGVVGPDAFPDIAYGQSIIHPVETSRWLGYILREAWAAQDDPTYSADEKGQILAFAYGFLTHVAGDMWAHTLVNDFSGGVFPSVFEIPSKPLAAQIALRHNISEGGYIGSATPGWDNADSEEEFVPGTPCSSPQIAPPDTVCNPGTPDEETLEASRVCADPDSPPAPGTTCKVEGPFGTMVPDVSLDSSPGIAFDAPHEFIQRTMIDLSAGTPADGCDGTNPDRRDDGMPDDNVANDGCPGGPFTVGEKPELTRGPILDFILNQEANLQVAAAKTRFDANRTLCTTLDPDCHVTTRTLTVNTVRGIAHPTVPDTECTANVFCFADPVDLAQDVIDGLIASYEEAWIDDIDEMRDHWSEFSLGVMRGLFDPQTLRDAANDACAFEGPESVTNNARNACEHGLGPLDPVLFSLENFYPSGTPSWIDRYLIPASGLPDAIADIRSFLTSVGSAIEDVFTTVGIQNPISAILADAEAFVRDKINRFIKGQYGIDIDAIAQFASSPGQWMCGTDAGNPVSITFPPPIGTITPGGIFTPADHARIDELMGMESGHHEAAPGLPVDCSPLRDDAKFNLEEFAALKNSVTTAKLLLLNGSELNHVLGDLLATEGVVKSASLVSTYSDPPSGAPADVMVDGLDANGDANAELPWLELADGDHGWRQDGLPRFCDNNGSGACTPLPPDLPVGTNPTPRPLESELKGQENAGNGHFPIWESCLLRPAFRLLYDDWENENNAFETNFPDLGDKPSADASDSDAPLTGLTASGTTFTSGGRTFIGADNEFALTATDDVFTDDLVGLRYRVFRDGTAPGSFVPIDNGEAFSLSGPDGLYHVEVQSEDPCHTFDPTDSLEAGSVLSESFVLDTTDPEIAIASPAPEGVVFDTDDVSRIAFTVTETGSGVASSSVTLDGTSATNGQVLDMFFLGPGLHTLVVTATDNLGNSSRATRTFEVHATAQSLDNNIDRACSLGLIKATLCNALKAKARAALAAHNRGHHVTEHNILKALVHQLEAKRGNGVDVATANRLIAYIEDLIREGD